ncbi:MAG: 2-oxoacid:acceptor oxidoreductase family protein, partial [Chloroflexi bacterium]|nr:2-oxoacid:acceptor oxidoreductase family protein [Chloroflexota bacterium]
MPARSGGDEEGGEGLSWEVTISGFGGQGVLFIGRLLLEAGFAGGQQVSWLPYYSGEKRGGMCTCFVNISDERIGSIFISHPDVGVAMNPAAYKMLEPTVKQDGLLIVNESLVKTKSQRPDIKTIYVPTVEAARELGDETVGNIIALGAILASAPVVTTSSIIKVLNQMMSKNKRQLEL